MGRPPYALDRDQGERLMFGETVILLRTTEESGGGALTIWEEVPPLLDTPLHLHANEDELFHIIEGEHEFRWWRAAIPRGARSVRLPAAGCPARAPPDRAGQRTVPRHHHAQRV
jgi:hypothetical protein